MFPTRNPDRARKKTVFDAVSSRTSEALRTMTARRSRPGRSARTRRLALGGSATVGLAASLVMAVGLDAAAAPQDKQDKKVSTAAERAGITADGGGYAGWSMRNNPQASAERDPGSAGRIAPKAATRLEGIDVASYQGNVNWSQWWNQGKRFAYVKATEGRSYKNPYFSQQYNGSYRVGMVRGSYHFARPDGASGASQARYFVNRGGDWSADGKTLPGAIDIEDNYLNPNKRCWGNTKSANTAWLKSFVQEYRKLTGRSPVIYSNAGFWEQCVGSKHNFARSNPLWIAYWSSNPPSRLINQWNYWTFWQYHGTGTDLNRFSGNMTQLRQLAKG